MKRLSEEKSKTKTKVTITIANEEEMKKYFDEIKVKYKQGTIEKHRIIMTNIGEFVQPCLDQMYDLGYYPLSISLGTYGLAILFKKTWEGYNP